VTFEGPLRASGGPCGVNRVQNRNSSSNHVELITGRYRFVHHRQLRVAPTTYDITTQTQEAKEKIRKKKKKKKKKKKQQQKKKSPRSHAKETTVLRGTSFRLRLYLTATIGDRTGKQRRG
jgi:hypothetical protein